MKHRPRAALAVRLRTLAVLELGNVIWIGWVVFAAFDAPTSAANVSGYALTAVLLLTGSGYWSVKLRQLRAGLPRPPLIGLFRWPRFLCAAGLAAGAVVMGASLARRPEAGEVAPGLLLYVLALAEYVNYFHWQLMHDTAADWHRLLRTRRLRRSHLHDDLRAYREQIRKQCP
ncbi:hypothetical protein SSP24_55960 [Streptomyces spinoverrucosus]|uniref:Uncharacterized protein n=1 Tax=Streptomyces spinoverrucosus TaxID=284043 RepID=A0A4Y3VQE2_9ACTN|nr:hypothetical protein SSP24_55960 [Streptomyces spinoverrucosus]GHB85859.1 hypothetical protein GCM10010397_66580 [Streptomyces spinoverrucosus]